MAKILISGGSGFTGRALTKSLLLAGHEVSWLTRKPAAVRHLPAYRIDPQQMTVETEPFKTADAVVNLSGAGIMDHRWTKQYRRQIEQSRAGISGLISKAIDEHGANVRVVVFASATGYYGAHPHGEVCSEDSSPGGDFLASVCIKWEASNKVERPGIRQVTLRTGVVLGESGGAYPRLAALFRKGFGSAIGSGRQPFPWIHLQDLVRIYEFALAENAMEGAYNAVSGECVTNREFSRALAHSLGSSLWMPNVPAFLLRSFLGSRASLLLEGQCVSNQRLLGTGFTFHYPSLRPALEALAKAT